MEILSTDFLPPFGKVAVENRRGIEVEVSGGSSCVAGSESRLKEGLENQYSVDLGHGSRVT